MACIFQATIAGEFAPVIGLTDEDMDINTTITTYSAAVTDTVSEILGKEHCIKSLGHQRCFQPL